MRIIPAIDLIDGKCVRLEQGDYSKKTLYNENPLAVAKEFEVNGIKYLHLVDLDGAKAGKVVNHKVLEKITNQTSLKVDFSGGIRHLEAVKTAFDSGANQVTCGSIAAKNPDLFFDWVEIFGSQKMVLGADTLNEKIAVGGWLESENLDLIPFLTEMQRRGILYVMCTDISKDGMLQGPSVDLYKKILNNVQSINLIASGGVSNVEDLEILKENGLEAAIIGKAIYEGKITLNQLSKFL
jgi:phosphoribosylformimino-5-aminoimidazole carboxamide ribotide isomerase